jgi:hypothetical protein
MDKNILGKKTQIININNLRVISTSVAVFIVIFCFFAIKSLYSEGQYQNRVISAQKITLDKLNSNLSSVKNIESAYKVFNSNLEQNIIGGNTTVTTGNNGNNSKIVLDALPTNIDVPAWSLNISNLCLLLAQPPSFLTLDPSSVAVDQATVSPVLKPVPIPIALAGTFSVNPDNIGATFDSLYRSIIPIKIKSVSITSGSKGKPAIISFQAGTYYQAPYKFLTSTEIVK